MIFEPYTMRLQGYRLEKRHKNERGESRKATNTKNYQVLFNTDIPEIGQENTRI